MTSFAIVLLLVALIAAVLGFGGVSVEVELARIVFFIAITLFAVVAVFALAGRRDPMSPS